MKLLPSFRTAPRAGVLLLALAWIAPLASADETDRNLYYDPTKSNTTDTGGTGTSSSDTWWTGNARHTWATGSSGSIATYWNLYFGGAGQTQPYTYTTALTTTTISGANSSDLRTLSLIFQGDYLYTKNSGQTNTSTVGGSGNYGYLSVLVDPNKTLTLAAGTDAAQSNRIAFVSAANNSSNPALLLGGGGTIIFGQNTDLRQTNANGHIRVGEANKATTLTMNAGSTLTATRMQIAAGTVSINGIDATLSGSASARGNNAILLGGNGTAEEGFSPATFNLNSGSVTALSGVVRPDPNNEDRPYGQGAHGIAFGVNPVSSSLTDHNALVGGTFNLNGGTLTTTDIFANPHATDATTAKFVFNGGKLFVSSAATQEQLDGFISGFQDTANNHVAITSAGAFIDTGAIDTANTNGAATISSAMRGEGALTKTGAGTLVLTGNNTYLGGTVIEQGTVAGNVAGGNVAIASGATYALGGADQTVADLSGAGSVSLGEHTLTLGSANNTNFGGAISGAGNLNKAGSGTLTLSGANTYSGATTVSAGTLSGNISNGALTIAAGGTYQLGGVNRSVGALAGGGSVQLGAATLTTDSADDAEFAGVISGTGGLVKNGDGKLTLSGQNTFTGDTRVNRGTLQLNTVTMMGNIINDALVIWDQLTGADYDRAMSGTGALHKTGAGTLRLTGANTYTGGTTVFDGTLEGTTTSLQGAFTNHGVVTFNQSFAGTYAGAMSGTGSLVKAGAGALTLTGANSYSGGTTVHGGSLIVNTSSLQGAIHTSAELVFNQSTNGTFNGTLSGNGTVQKFGSGMLSLTGEHAFAGATNVAAGGLRLNGYLASRLNVLAPAQLTGSGWIGGDTFIAGLHAPGDPVGLQGFSANLTYIGGASIAWQLMDNAAFLPALTRGDGLAGNGMPFDQVFVGGTLNFQGATLLNLSFNTSGSSVDWLNPFWDESQNWVIFVAEGAILNSDNLQIAPATWLDAAGVNLASARNGATFNLSVQGNEVLLSYTAAAIPEPSTYALLGGLAALVVVGYRRRTRASRA